MITVRECTYDDLKRYKELEGEYHYMGESHGAGDTVRLIFDEPSDAARGPARATFTRDDLSRN